MITFLQIGSYIFPAPIVFSIDYEDLDSGNTTRNERGVLSRDRIRSSVMKVQTSFRVRISELEDMANAIEPKTFTAKVFDLTTAKVVTKTMYAASKHSEIAGVVDKSDPSKTWVDYSFNLIEC